MTDRDADDDVLGDVLKHPPYSPPSRPGEDPPRLAHPERIGAHRILDVLGSGGMGVVYLAEEQEPPRRRVALKIIKPGMDSEQVLTRFEAERHALELLNHPNVARVLGGGSTDEGRPYFVMEYVPGIPITDYCDQEQLGITERLELFRAVCDAVQHAHQNGIIHRDIKPTNVLVTTDGGSPVPKVIDFGVAKATQQRLTEKTLFTEQGQLIGTPEYMSPEQAEMTGLGVDTRTDVYSLGILLYELLTGALPFDSESLRKAAFGEMQRIVREQEPPKPSTRLSRLGDESSVVAGKRRTSPGALVRRLRGDLDWITMKAMEKNRTRRYETVSALAADVRRHLETEPVEAGPPSAAYRLQKFVRRNRTAVAASTFVMAAMVVATIVSNIFAIRASAQRRAAEQAQIAFDMAVRFQARLLGDIDAESLGRALIAELRSRIEAADRDRGESEFEALLAAFDELVALASPTDVATRVFDEQILRPALALVDEQLSELPMVEAQLRHTIGFIYAKHDLRDDAEEQFRLSEELSREHGGLESDLRLATINNLANLLEITGRLEESISLHSAAFEIRKRVKGPEHPLTLDSMFNLADAYLWASELDKARPLSSEVLSIRRRKFGNLHERTISSMSQLAELNEMQANYEVAGRLYEEAYDSSLRAFGADSPDTIGTLHNLGIFRAVQGEYERAEPLLLEALRHGREKHGNEHQYTLSYLASVGVLYDRWGKPDKAIEYGELALEATRRAHGDRDDLTMLAASNLGGMYAQEDRFELAEPLLIEAVASREQVSGPFHRRTLISRNELGGMYARMGLLDKAIPLLESVVEDARRTGNGRDHFGSFLVSLGHALTEAGRFPEAEDALLEAYELDSGSFSPDHPRVVEAVRRLVELHESWGSAEPDGGHEARAAEWRAKLPESGG